MQLSTGRQGNHSQDSYTTHTHRRVHVCWSLQYVCLTDRCHSMSVLQTGVIIMQNGSSCFFLYRLTETTPILSSVPFFSRPRSEGWPHHGRTFSIYPCPLSCWLTLPRGVLSTSWCCPPRLCVAFLACVHLALFLFCFFLFIKYNRQRTWRSLTCHTTMSQWLTQKEPARYTNKLITKTTDTNYRQYLQLTIKSNTD